MAGFANGNWALSVLLTVMAIELFTDDQVMFDCAIKSFHRGKDNARFKHYAINEDGNVERADATRSTPAWPGLPFRSRRSRLESRTRSL